MTPKEKAQQLYQKYETLGKDFTRGVSMREFAKECALIVVDEIIDAIDWHEYEVPNKELKYYFEVKQEIEQL